MDYTLIKRRVAIVEDEFEVRESYKFIIDSSSKFTVVGAHSDFEDAFHQLKKTRPDIILMDIGLPGINGIDGTRKIKKMHPHIEIVMITVFEDSELVFNALKNGASGYISKSSNYLELLNALEEITKGGAPMSSKIARMLVTEMHLNNNNPLAYRETGILKLVSVGKTYSQISDELGISKETVKTHLRNIYRKLHVNKKSEAIKIGLQQKLI